MGLEEFIAEKLKSVDLHDETFAYYIAGIITEPSLDDEEKRQGVVDFLTDATDLPSEALIDSFMTEWRDMQERDKQAQREIQIGLDQLQISASTPAAVESSPSPIVSSNSTAKQPLSKEEQKRREMLLARYSYESSEDETENISYSVENGGKGGKGRGGGGEMSLKDVLLQPNRNAELVKEKEQARREQMRKQHETGKERNRQLLEKQKQDVEKQKEKEKKRTMKKEKRRM